MVSPFYRAIRSAYRQKVYPRADGDGAVFYYDVGDFPGLTRRDYPFRSSRGHALAGWLYFRGEARTDRLVVFDHGIGSGHRGYLREIELLTRQGYTVFAYDHTGCMESGGEDTGGLCQSLIDLDDLLTTLKADPAFRETTFSVVGHSWGGFAALNIAAFHPDVTHAVAFAGFRSLACILGQTLDRFPLKRYCRRILREECGRNPRYAGIDALETLRNAKTKVLAAHSADDPVVSFERNFLPLQRELGERDNLTFLRVDGKRHNPHYTRDAVAYKDAFFKDYRDAQKRHALTTDAEKNAFRTRYDWARMTAQDETVWQTVCKFLET